MRSHNGFNDVSRNVKINVHITKEAVVIGQLFKNDKIFFIKSENSVLDETGRAEIVFDHFVVEHNIAEGGVKIRTNVENNVHTSEALLRSEFGVSGSKCPAKFIPCGG